MVTSSEETAAFFRIAKPAMPLFGLLTLPPRLFSLLKLFLPPSGHFPRPRPLCLRVLSVNSIEPTYQLLLRLSQCQEAFFLLLKPTSEHELRPFPKRFEPSLVTSIPRTLSSQLPCVAQSPRSAG